MGPSHKVGALLIFAASLPHLSHALKSTANFTALCEKVRSENILENPFFANLSTYKCGQTYKPDTIPAMPITISLPRCLEQSPGYQISDIKQLQQWIGPFVGFILPSLAFVVSVPRLVRVPRFDEFFTRKVYIRVPWVLVTLILMLFDLVFYIIAVFALAGPLMAGALHEVVLDHEVLCTVDDALREQRKWNAESQKDEQDVTERPPMESAEEALLESDLPRKLEISKKEARAAILFSLVGSFDPDSGTDELSLSRRLIQDIDQSPHRKSKLYTLIALLPSYASIVGFPITFYLGAYTYSLVDAGSRRGDDDTAHSISFGLWYGVIVILANICSTVLGIENPAILEAVFSGTMTPIKRSKAKRFSYYTSTFRPTWLWDRAYTFRKWATPGAEGLQLGSIVKAKIHSRGLRVIAALLAVFFMALPCVLACFIAYYTPTVGFSCRAVTILVYSLSQLILILGWLYHSDPLSHPHAYSSSSVAGKIHNSILKKLIYAFLGFIALLGGAFPAIGGTIMQLVGVYRNCLCNAGLKYMISNRRYLGVVQLATDTEEHRKGYRSWNGFGMTGIVCMGIISIMGWYYQMRARSRLKRLVRKLF